MIPEINRSFLPLEALFEKANSGTLDRDEKQGILAQLREDPYFHRLVPHGIIGVHYSEVVSPLWKKALDEGHTEKAKELIGEIQHQNGISDTLLLEILLEFRLEKGADCVDFLFNLITFQQKSFKTLFSALILAETFRTDSLFLHLAKWLDVPLSHACLEEDLLEAIPRLAYKKVAEGPNRLFRILLENRLWRSAKILCNRNQDLKLSYMRFQALCLHGLLHESVAHLPEYPVCLSKFTLRLHLTPELTLKRKVLKQIWSEFIEMILEKPRYSRAESDRLWEELFKQRHSSSFWHKNELIRLFYSYNQISITKPDDFINLTTAVDPSSRTVLFDKSGLAIQVLAEESLLITDAVLSWVKTGNQFETNGYTNTVPPKSDSFWTTWETTEADNFYKKILHPAFIQILPALIKGLEAPKVLEICGGKGDLASRLPFSLDTEYTLFERNAHSLQVAQEKLGSRVKVVKKDVLNDAFDIEPASLDLVFGSGAITLEVLQVGPPTNHLLRKIRDSLKPNGFLVLAGRSYPIFNSKEFRSHGFKVLNQSLPGQPRHFYILQPSLRE